MDKPGEIQLFQRSPEAEEVMKRLLAMEPGSTAEWSELERAVRLSRRKVVSLVYRVRQMIEKTRAAAFVTVEGIGVRRLTDAENVEITPKRAARKMRSAARRGKRSLLCVQNIEALSEDERAKFNTGMLIVSVVDHVTSAKSIKRISVEIDEASRFSLATESVIKQLTDSRRK
jgi:hypothetical protein